MKVLVVLAVLLAVALAAPRYTPDHFRAWMSLHGKAYETAEEEKTRFAIWLNNMEFVDNFAKRNPDATFTVEINKFGDLTAQEFGRMYNTFKFDPASVDWRFTPIPEGFVPQDSVDWRTKGAVTGVKDQGQCGSCYSFSTTGSVEGCHFLATNNLVSLSEQNILDCSSSYGNQGCNGGLMTSSMNYIEKNGGLDTEASYPYQARQGTCQYKSSNSGTTLGGYTNVQSGSENDLIAKINQGPVSVAIDASHSSFQFYKSGVYYESACSSSQLDHGVLAVGYGSTGQSNGDYYIVKNSWGTSWGQAGYIWMSRGRNNNCGIATMATLPTGCH